MVFTLPLKCEYWPFFALAKLEGGSLSCSFLGLLSAVYLLLFPKSFSHPTLRVALHPFELIVCGASNRTGLF